MTTGIKIRGSAGNIQIDDQNPVYVVKESGTFGVGNYAAYGGSGAYAYTVSFNTFVTTQEPPLVFIRFTSPDCVMSQFSIIGSPGNWSGFMMRLGYISPQLANHVADDLREGKWFIGVVNPGASGATRGVRVRSSITGDVIFDTGHRLVRFVEQNYNFVSEGRVTHYTLQFSVGYPSTEDREVYFLANTFTGMLNHYGRGNTDWMWVGYYYSDPKKLFIYTANPRGAIPYQGYMWTALFATIN